MLTLANLRTARGARDITRPQLATLTDISAQRLRQLELRTHEPWFDEAALIASCLRTGGILPLISSDRLTTLDFGLPLPNDADLWRQGIRAPLSLACRVASAFGLPDPADLSTTALARQIWEVLETSERLPGSAEHSVAYICPWCSADRFPTDAGQAPHLATCLPHNLWGGAIQIVDETSVTAALRPETKRARGKGVPAHNLKAHRLAGGHTQRAVANVIDVTANYYARLERGNVPLMQHHAERLAVWYKVSREALYAPAS